MATTKTRRCVGSERFGIEAHEAPEVDFPKQPSQPGGLGRLCVEHWKAYTAGLRKDALVRNAGEPTNDEAPTTATRRRIKKATTKATSSNRSRKPSPKAEEIEPAEALVAEVDALPADEAVKRVGDDDVQQALEVSAAASTSEDSAAWPGTVHQGPGLRGPSSWAGIRSQ